MAVSYKKLFHLLIDKDISVADLQRQAGYSANISTRLRNNSYVSLESMEKICRVLDCKLDDVVEFVLSEKEKIKSVSTGDTIHERGFLMNELDNTFAEIAQIIKEARDNAYRKVNEELILMYQRVGQFLSEKSKEANYGDGYIDSLSDYIQHQFPGIKGFNRRGLYRMKQFYETYAGNEKVSPLVTQLSWTNHLLIMSGSKSDEEREFYMRLAIKERYSKRQLERQMDSGYYERYMLSKSKLLPEPLHSEQNPFLDQYVVEFLDLPDTFHENDFRKALVKGMRDFILELGKDFTFVGEEYPIQVGGEDYRIDLLFFHRSLHCLVAMELKVGKFKPEYVSKMDFYLEGLDRQIKKPDENPSVGLLLCASKNDEVVEYAMSRTLSPMMVAQYQLQLPDKDVLRKKLQELSNLPEIEESTGGSDNTYCF